MATAKRLRVLRSSDLPASSVSPNSQVQVEEFLVPYRFGLSGSSTELDELTRVLFSSFAAESRRGQEEGCSRLLKLDHPCSVLFHGSPACRKGPKWRTGVAWPWPLFDVFSVLLLIVVYGREQAMTVLGSCNAVVLGVHESIPFLACF